MTKELCNITMKEIIKLVNDQVKYEQIISNMAEEINYHGILDSQRPKVCPGCTSWCEDAYCDGLHSISNPEEKCINQIINYFKKQVNLDSNKIDDYYKNKVGITHDD